MVNTKFEGYKLKREIKRSGTEYTFNRPSKNDCGEPDSSLDPEVIATIGGLYHEENSSISITTGDTTQTRTKKTPMILCEYSDVASLAVGDYVTINSKTFNITGVLDIQEWGIVADISLEVVDSVVQT